MTEKPGELCERDQVPFLKHLALNVRPLAQRDVGQRIASLAEDRWIDYARGRDILDRLDRMIALPKTTRPPGLLIYGDSNIGKSMIVRKFLRSQTDDDSSGTGRPRAKVISIQMPSAPQERRLYGQLLLAMGAHYRPAETLGAVEHRAMSLLRVEKPQMIIVDEVHNLLAGSPREQRASLNLLKFLSNDLKCAIVVLGTHDALAAIQSDDQIASRLPSIELPRWKQNNDFRGFLAGFERQLPLQHPSLIADNRAMVPMLMGASGGVTGVIRSLLLQAAEVAIQTKTERITENMLKSITAKAL